MGHEPQTVGGRLAGLRRPLQFLGPHLGYLGLPVLPFLTRCWLVAVLQTLPENATTAHLNSLLFYNLRQTKNRHLMASKIRLFLVQSRSPCLTPAREPSFPLPSLTKYDLKQQATVFLLILFTFYNLPSLLPFQNHSARHQVTNPLYLKLTNKSRDQPDR